MPVFSIKEIQENEVSTDLGKPNGPWVPARPHDGPWICRVRAAWGVLIGKYDALDWGPGQRGGHDDDDHMDNDSFISRGQG